MSEELKPCPFCGFDMNYGKGWPVFSFGTRAMGYIVCPHCGTISGFGRTIDESVKAWNRRINNASTEH